MIKNSNRRRAFSAPQSNPTTIFIDWKSNEKHFSYYDKENKIQVAIPLPFRFLALNEMHTVKGWSDAFQSGIYSNEVKLISTQPLSVKTFKNDKIATGLYSEIKEKIKAAGAHYVKSVYVMLDDGSLANLQLKGSACQAWSDFTKKNRSRISEEWITVANAIEGKKGAVTFYSPEFRLDKSLSKNEVDLADELFNTLEIYLNSYFLNSNSQDKHSAEDEEDVLDFDV